MFVLVFVSFSMCLVGDVLFCFVYCLLLFRCLVYAVDLFYSVCRVYFVLCLTFRFWSLSDFTALVIKCYNSSLTECAPDER